MCISKRIKWILKKSHREKKNFLHIFSIHSSSRYEKWCRMLQRLFWLFQCSKTPLWQGFFCSYVTIWPRDCLQNLPFEFVSTLPAVNWLTKGRKTTIIFLFNWTCQKFNFAVLKEWLLLQFCSFSQKLPKSCLFLELFLELFFCLLYKKAFRYVQSLFIFILPT